MPDLTQPPDMDEALRKLVEQPSYAARVLVFTAGLLERDPAEPMTDRAGGLAMTMAIDAVLGKLPQAVRDDSVARATTAMPDLTGDITRGEAALRLRAASKSPGMSTPRCARPKVQSTTAIVQQLLGEMAGRLETHRPNATITTLGRHALLQATTMDPPVLRALRKHAPEIDVALTRRQYAAQLRTAASTLAHEVTE
ncbi:hypothetical protein ACIQFU_23015 [Streptomyces sp. NPDC093065]|uniref:hypothetical protein n=1 Tax=Streptomyces sp. NPDC093065 TaxID=3366021 RepID=UPI003829AD4B